MAYADLQKNPFLFFIIIYILASKEGVVVVKGSCWVSFFLVFAFVALGELVALQYEKSPSTSLHLVPASGDTPWYTGPLLAPSAEVFPPRQFNLQPYLFYTNHHARYDNRGHSKKMANLHVWNPQIALLFGIVDWMDGNISVQGFRNRQSQKSAIGWGDCSVGLGFGLLSEGENHPAVLLSLKENLPSGKYQHLDPEKNGLDGMGSGAFQTTVGLNLSKRVRWFAHHPISFRFAQNVGMPASVSVSGDHVYDSDPYTNGKVRLGYSYVADGSCEYSITHQSVFTVDVVYAYSEKTKFSDHCHEKFSDVTLQPYSTSVSLAPGYEWNVNENLGLVAGVWFTVWGRNCSNFVSGIATFTYTF